MDETQKELISDLYKSLQEAVDLNERLQELERTNRNISQRFAIGVGHLSRQRVDEWYSHFRDVEAGIRTAGR